jgi:8-oxo-dGTP diphosphatase
MSSILGADSAPPKPNPRVGVGVFVFNSKQEFVLGKRLGSHGSGTYALPGGHLAYGESFEECSAREILEETGLKVKNIKFLTATNDVMEKEGKHYVTIFMGCEVDDENAEPKVSW